MTATDDARPYLADDYFENAMPFGGAGGTRTGRGRVGGLFQLAHMTDVRCAIFTLGG